MKMPLFEPTAISFLWQGPLCVRAEYCDFLILCLWLIIRIQTMDARRFFETGRKIVAVGRNYALVPVNLTVSTFADVLMAPAINLFPFCTPC